MKSVTIASSNSGTKSLASDNKVADLFTKSILKTNGVFKLQGDQKSTFRFQKLEFFITTID